MFGERNILALLLTLCLLAVSVLPGWAEETPGAAIPDAYEKIAENSRFNLYLRRDTLALIVESKATGKVMYSTVQNPEDMKDNAAWKGFYQSGIVMEYLEGVKNIPLQADFINTPMKSTVP